VLRALFTCKERRRPSGRPFRDPTSLVPEVIASPRGAAAVPWTRMTSPVSCTRHHRPPKGRCSPTATWSPTQAGPSWSTAGRGGEIMLTALPSPTPTDDRLHEPLHRPRLHRVIVPDRATSRPAQGHRPPAAHPGARGARPLRRLANTGGHQGPLRPDLHQTVHERRRRLPPEYSAASRRSRRPWWRATA